MNHLSSKVYGQILLILFCAMSLLVIPSVSADEYFADITIEVDEAGFVTIDGTTNYPNLLVSDSSKYTSKTQSYWLLNITMDELFMDVVFDVTFPKGTSINYLKTSSKIRLEAEEKSIQLKGFIENDTFSLLVQYQIEKTHDDTASLFENPLGILIVSLIVYSLLLAGVFWWYKTPRTKNNAVKTLPAAPELKGINERQKQIISLLEEKKVPLTQTDLQKELNIPKAAVSRNIRGLERKGLIEKEQIGMSNLIRLKKP